MNPLQFFFTSIFLQKMSIITKNEKVSLPRINNYDNPILIYHLKKSGDFFNIKLDHVLINFFINRITFNLNENKLGKL